MNAERLKEIICQDIEQRFDSLNDISTKIWSKPELGFEETFAHELLTTFLDKEGFEVSRKTPLPTSFIAKYGDGSGIKVGILVEYDALPGIGHACGHNLIAELGIGAALGMSESNIVIFVAFNCKSAFSQCEGKNQEIAIIQYTMQQNFGKVLFMLIFNRFDMKFCSLIPKIV